MCAAAFVVWYFAGDWIFDDMKTSVSLYELAGKAGFRSRQGALLRVQFDDGLIGYADCHPWKELGAAPLEEQLRALAQNNHTPLIKRSLYFARLDAEARAKGVSLFKGLAIPASHWLVPNLTHCNFADVEAAIQRGFPALKIKIDEHIAEELPRLERLLATLPPQIKLRLDFNQKLSSDAFKGAFKAISRWHDRVEFYEDPFAFESSAWEEMQGRGAHLACDQHATKAIALPHVAKVLVLKPAVQAEDPFLHLLGTPQRVVITSCLDHPVGQLAAAYVAAECNRRVAGRMLTCGLMSHHAYQPNEFSAQLQAKGPVLQPPSGTGFGFDDLLKRQQWKSL